VTPPTKTHQGQDFASGYARSHRLYETVVIFVGITVWTALALRLRTTESVSGWWAPLAMLLGLLAADFASGVIHWTFDTWGSVNTPIVGQLAVRQFREHHVDASSITRHDFVETNGHNVGLSIVPSVVGLVVLGRGTHLCTVIAMALFSMAAFVALTSQIHKWAHMATPPRIVRWLQNMRLFISARHHAAHHQAPNDRYYCITVGWLNRPLQEIRFFETLERVITTLTGATPRGGEDTNR